MKVRLEIELDISDFLIEATGGDPVDHVVWENVINAAQLYHLRQAMDCLVQKSKAETMELTVVGPEVWDAMANGRKHWANVLQGQFEHLKITTL